MATPTLTQRLANPSQFMALSARLLPWVAGLATALLAAALYLAFFVAPPDYQQGETVRIMFLHVPAAWLGLMAYLVIAASSFGLLVFRHPLADVSAKAAAPIGAALTLGARRGGLLIALLVLPLYVPTLIFGISTIGAALLGPAGVQPSLLILAAISLFAAVLGPFAAAAALRLQLN